ncbi:MAG: biotin/lipoyl-containing protein [Planctomycetales bacterium]
MAAVPITLPDLGAGDEPVRVSLWLVDPGQPVLEADRVVELLVSGITFDVSAPVSGTLTRVERIEHTIVATGDVLGWIDTAEP